MNDESAASSRCRPTLKLLRVKSCSITQSLLALKEVTKIAIFVWPLVHGGVGFSRPAGIPSLSCCDSLTSDLLPGGGPETQLLIQADFVQLWDIPSVKCHLFYIYSTEVTKWRTIFLLAPHARVYTVHAGKSENKKQKKRPFFFNMYFLCVASFKSIKALAFNCFIRFII